jgi:hypothetical protein
MADNVQIDLIRLANGERLLRFTEPKSGIALERNLDPARPVSEQKTKLAKVFEAAVAQAQLSFA